jgi:hypothetical protein
LPACRSAEENLLFRYRCERRRPAMTTHLISFFADDTARASFENHRRYCARHAYTHEYVDASGIGWPHLRMLLKYQLLLRTLRSRAEGDLVLMLTEDCLLVRNVACETLMRDAARDWIVTSVGDGESDAVLAGFQLWRNTAASRERVGRICQGTKFGGRLAHESSLLRELNPTHYLMRIEGWHATAVAGFDIDP